MVNINKKLNLLRNSCTLSSVTNEINEAAIFYLEQINSEYAGIVQPIEPIIFHSCRKYLFEPVILTMQCNVVKIGWFICMLKRITDILEILQYQVVNYRRRKLISQLARCCDYLRCLFLNMPLFLHFHIDGSIASLGMEAPYIRKLPISLSNAYTATSDAEKAQSL